MSLPNLTNEQRRQALEKAKAVRSERCAFRAALKAGNIPAETALDAPIAQRMRVLQLLESLPGIGTARAAKIMDKVGIAESRRVQGLGDRQRAALLSVLEGALR